MLRVLAEILCGLLVAGFGAFGVAAGRPAWWSPLPVPSFVLVLRLKLVAPATSPAGVLAFVGTFWGMSFLAWIGLASLGRRSIPLPSFLAVAALLVSNVAWAIALLAFDDGLPLRYHGASHVFAVLGPAVLLPGLLLAVGSALVARPPSGSSSSSTPPCSRWVPGLRFPIWKSCTDRGNRRT